MTSLPVTGMAVLLALVLQAGCAGRRAEDQMKFLLDELTIVREELKKYPPQIHALEEQVRAQRRSLLAEIERLRGQVAELEQRLARRGEPPPLSSPHPEPDPAGRIRQLGPDRYEVSRSALSRTSLMRAARIVPAVRNGRPVGFKLFAIRPGSVLNRMGLKNGDTVLSVNGRALTSPVRALGVYTSLRTARKVTLELTRRGRPLTLRYTLVP